MPLCDNDGEVGRVVQTNKLDYLVNESLYMYYRYRASA